MREKYEDSTPQETNFESDSPGNRHFEWKIDRIAFKDGPGNLHFGRKIDRIVFNMELEICILDGL